MQQQGRKFHCHLMELRSCSHLHFIQAIKDGSVIKILNVNHGRPALTFKKVKEIYEAGDAEQYDSSPTIQPRYEFGCFGVSPNKIKSGITCLSWAERRATGLQASEFRWSDGDEGNESDSDDLSFANMTLKQFKESCKARKRKCADSSNKIYENSFTPQHGYTNLVPEEDEDDLKPLSSWKSKISRSKKQKRKCTGNHMPNSSQSAILVAKPKQVPTDQNLWQPTGNLPAPIDIKVEVNETDHSNCPTLICFTSDYREQVDSCGVVSNEAHLSTSDCLQEADVSKSFTEEKSCIVNDELYGCMECANQKSVSAARVSGWEIMNVDIPEIINYEFPDFPAIGFDNEGYIIHPLPDEIAPEPISVSKDQDIVMYHNFQSQSSLHHVSWPCSSNDQVQVLDMAVDNRLQCMETIDVDDTYLCEDGTRDDLPSDLGESTFNPVSESCSSWSSTSCLGPDSCLVPVVDDSPLTEKKELFLSASADGERNCYAEMRPLDTTGEVMTQAGFGDYHHSELRCTPERLLSTRKTISPKSQERLCKAMNSIELHDDKHSECRGKLLFGKQNENEILKAEGCNKIRRAEVTINTKPVLRKPKYDKKGLHPGGVLKGLHSSSAVLGFSTGGTSTQSLSQSAVAFSQRQMQDIESLASKLTKELTYMKDLVKEMLHSEACPSTSLKHNMEKVTMAIKSANKAEETARRWLCIMARDCNRFCKIMTLTEAGSTASGNNVAYKDRRKITFADEAGGKLCHVQVFKDDVASQLESIDVEK